MKSKPTKTDAKKEIDSFFKKTFFSKDQVRKIKNLAMKYNIKLGEYRKQFCKKCNSQLKGKIIQISKTHKTIECSVCKYRNKFRII